MIAENLRALSYIFTDDIYIIQQEKHFTDAIPLPLVEEVKAVTFNYAGGNKKKFLILVCYPGQEAMEPSHFSALESTIKRKELTVDDIAILNVNNHPGIVFEEISAFFTPQKLLILGKDALPSGFNAPVPNRLIKLSDCDTLYSFSFTEMMGNRENTKAFWDEMKNL